MSPKKKNTGLKKLQSIVPKNLNLRKFKVNPTNVIEETKNKIGNFYTKLKLEREKEKKRQEKKRKNDEKRELLNQKRQAQKERLQKIREDFSSPFKRRCCNSVVLPFNCKSVSSLKFFSKVLIWSTRGLYLDNTCCEGFFKKVSNIILLFSLFKI